MIGTIAPRGRRASAPRRLLALILAFSLVLAPSSALAEREPTDLVSGAKAGSTRVRALPDIDAPSGVLLTMDGRELWARDPQKPRAMASITKVMTAVVVLERMRGKLDKRIRMSADAVAIEESSARWKVGQSVTVRQLLEAAVVHSANGAAFALAQEVGGNETGFVKLMNEKADALDLEDTLYVNSHGLDDPGHHSTARDIAVLARYAMKMPEYRRMAGLERVVVPGPDGPQTLEATNKLLGSYDGCTGIKTGWTDDAGYCLSAAARRGGNELVAVVLGASSEEERFRQTRALLDWGFKHYRTREVATAEETVGAVPVSDYLDVTVPVKVGGSQALPVFDLDGPVQRRIELDEEVTAPVRAGQRVGTVTVYQGDRMLAQLPAVTSWDVRRPGFFRRLQVSSVRLWRSVFGGARMARGTVITEGE